ncbi:MAG: GNAT family N-acetyltransferase [Acidimicrobiales bacterium]|jgi:GNAT superfamily N-acetyltransferase
MSIREASDDDWEVIYPFFVAIVSAGDSYAYPANLTRDEARPLWMERAPGRTVVAVREGRVVGTAKMGPNRPGRGAHVATASFMVDPNFQGHGIGAELGSYVVDWAKDAGYAAMQFNAVVETNVAAVRLWRSLGFEILTTVPEAFDHREHGLVGLHIMYLKF